MGKFFYRDNNDTEHEIGLTNVTFRDLSKGDVVIASYEVGDAPSSDVPFALTELRDLLVKSFPEDIKILVMATRNGQKDIELEVMKNKTRVKKS